MAETQREIESKFDVAPDFVLGDLGEMLNGPDGIDQRQSELLSTYYDTADFDLLDARMTVRQRTGTDDTGWHLKLPGEGFRTEYRWPLSAPAAGVDAQPPQPPSELADLIRPFTHDIGIVPVARLRVSRTRYRVLDAAGVLRFEVADDQVYVDSCGPVPITETRWREIEVELGPAGRRRDLRAVGAWLLARDAYHSASGSKLERALRGRSLEPLEDAQVTTVGTVVLNYLSAQIDALTSGHVAIASTPVETSTLSPDEAVHRMRVATRRLRSTLRTFTAVFDHHRVSWLDGELAWLASELGEVRDRQVLRARLARAVDELPAFLVVGPVAERVDQVLSSELRQHREALLATTRSTRYHALFVELVQWRTAAPLTDEATKPGDQLDEYVGAAQRRLDRKLKRAGRRSATDVELHSARKAGKRARYAGEAALPLLGKDAGELMRVAENLQNLLGEHQDAVVATELLRRIAEQVADEGGNTFTYGVLVADQRRIATESAAAARASAGNVEIE
jgi:CHAD domain-containing protein